MLGIKFMPGRKSKKKLKIKKTKYSSHKYFIQQWMNFKQTFTEVL